LEANRLIVKGLYFGGHNYTIKRYWETGPIKIYPKYLDYGYISYKEYSGTLKYYIYAGNHEVSEHKYSITGCFTLIGKAYIYLSIKCIYYKGPYFAISNSCFKKRIVIEEVKKKK
jgi:hypothetical protein